MDVAESTAMIRRLGSEKMADVLDRVLVTIADTISRYDGTIIDLAGDGALCIFGAPIAHEDDPSRALRSALAIVGSAALGSSDLHDRVGLRIGVHTGDVVVRALGGSYRLKYSAVGDAVHLAQRLQSSAEPGEILVSAATRVRARYGFVFGPEREVQAKGFRDPILAAALVGERSDSTGLPPEQPFIGRAAEIEILRGRIAAFARGVGGIVAIVGEPGIGKTSLLQQARVALPPDITWLNGRGYSDHRQIPYWTVGQVLRQAAGVDPMDAPEVARLRLDAFLAKTCGSERDLELRSVVELVTGLVPDSETTTAVAPAGDLRRAIIHGVRRVLGGLAANSPVVIAIEDLHWADPASAAVLDGSLSLIAERPLLFVLVSRPDDSSPGWELIDAAASRFADRLTQIQLAPLSTDDSLSLFQLSVGGGRLGRDLRELVTAKAEGIPLFVEELSRALVERLALTRRGDEWHLALPASDLTVPDTVQGVILSRIDRLPDPARRVLQVCSVLGRTFRLDVVKAMLEGEEVDEHLESLVRHQLVQPRPLPNVGEHAFRHALIQDVAYQSLLGRRRVSLHERAAEAMERQRFGLTSALPIIAEHYLRAERWPEAADRFGRAADEAARLYANTEAKLHYLRALEAISHLATTDEAKRLTVDVTIRLVGVAARSEDPAVNLDRIRDAELIARDLASSGLRDDQVRLATTKYWLGRLHYYRSELADALRELRAARKTAEDVGEPVLELLATSIIGSLLVLQGRIGEALPLIRRAADAFRGRDTGQWCRAAGYLAMALAAEGKYGEALDLCAAARDRAAKSNDLSVLGSAQLHLCVVHLLGGRTTRMRDDAAAAIEVAGRSGDAVIAATGFGFLGWAQVRLGLVAEAAANLSRRKELGEGLLTRGLILADLFAVAEAELAVMSARWSQALELCAEAVRSGAAIDSLLSPAMAHRLWATALARSGAEWTQIEPHLVLALQSFSIGDCRAEVVRTHLAWAGLTSDGSEMRRHLDTAARLIESHGLDLDIAQDHTIESLRQGV